MKKSEGVVMRGKSTKLSLSCAVFLFLCMLACVVCVASAKTIYVPDNYTKIQWAVDNATARDLQRADPEPIVSVGQETPSQPISNASPWPMLSHDPQNTGYTTFNGTKQADVYWKFSVCCAYIWDHHQAIVGDDGVIYFGTAKSKYGYPRGGLFTLYPNGTLKSRGFGECNVATPAIDESGDRYIYACDYYRGYCANDYTLYAYYKNGTLKWRKYVGFADSSGCVRLKVAGGTLYVSYRKDIKAISTEDGSDKWQFTSSDYISDFAVDHSGNVYIGDYSGNLYALKPDGSVIWMKSFPSKVSTILLKDSIIVGYAKNVSALNSDGTLKWRMEFSTDVYKLATKGDNVYVRTGDSVCSINTNGSLSWCKWVGGIYYYPDIIVDGKGVIYTTTSGSVVALDQNGTILWSYNVYHPGRISIGKDCLYVMAPDRTIICLKDLTPPRVKINSPSNGTTYLTSTVQINVSASDPSGIAKVIAQIDDATNVTLSFSDGYYVGTTPALANGNHWLRIYANDSFGNLNSTEVVYFAVSTTPVKRTLVVNQTDACTTGDLYFSTIGDAVMNANDCDTIIVCPGTYKENVVVNKSVEIRAYSQNPADTIVKANNSNDHVFYVTADNVTISGFTVTRALGYYKAGICLYNSNNCRIENVNASNNYHGILLYSYIFFSSSNIVANNTASNNHYGIFLFNSSNNTITNNKASLNTWSGIEITSSSNNTIVNNIVSNNCYGSGICLHHSSNNIIANNTASSNNYGGICLHCFNSNNTITNNTFYLNGMVVRESYNNKVTNNMVNGKPLVYLENVSDYVVKDAGQIIAINSNNITIKDLNLSYATVGIEFWNTSNSKIINNTITLNNWFGMSLRSSSNSNIIANNTVSNNKDGIYLDSSNNTVTNNTISKNTYGIYLYSSDNNIIYLNNFIDNTDNVYSYYSTNIWNSTEPITYTYNGSQHTNYLGNYWGDYTGSDADGDGIGDTPYSIDGDKDNYPLMERFENYIVTPVPNQPPIANFTYSPEKPVVNQSVTFDASSSYDPDGNITAYEWDFGDGNFMSTTEEKITHIYASPGNYTVNLTVTDDEGAKNSTSKEVSVQPADKTPPIITFVPPTPANNSILNINWVFINITLNENGTAILNWNGVNETMLGCGKNFYKNVTNLSDGTYTYKVYANDTSNNWNVSETRVVVIDTTPPASISNLTSIRGQTWINWTWTNPQDADFNYTMVYLNGIWRTNTSHPFYNATNLTPNTSYEIGTRTVDKAGNINQSWVNQTTKTRPYPAPKITSFAPQSPVYDNEGTTRTFNITVDQVVNVSWWINGTEVFNQTAVTESTYTNSSAAIGTWNVSVIVSNANGTAMQTWIWHVTSPCFIATAAYGTPLHEDIDVLRDFRDEYLMTNPIGREFVKIYYTVSPPIADVIRENEGLRTIVREGLVKPLVYILKELQNQNRVKP